MTIADAADSMHVSAASVSDIISKHRKAALKQVVTLEPADHCSYTRLITVEARGVLLSMS